LRITLLGTGDAPGTPVVGCTCKTCQAAVRGTKSSRTRFSILVQNEFEDESGNTVEGRVLIDCSPDIRFQLLRENISGRFDQKKPVQTHLPIVIDNIVFTHAHYDHFSGLGEFYRVQPVISIYGVSDTLNSICNFFSYFSPHIQKNEIGSYETFSLIGLDFMLFDVVHQPVKQPVGIIIKNERSKVVITGDCNQNIPEKSLDVIKDPDLFIANAIIPDNYVAGPIHKHMNAIEAMEIAKKINAKDTILSHLSHYYPPHEEAIKKGLKVGFDGMKFEL